MKSELFLIQTQNIENQQRLCHKTGGNVVGNLVAIEN